MTTVNVKDIMATQKQRQQKRHEVFDQIMEKINRLIVKSIKVLRNNNSCVYEVPEFLIGSPLYELNECINYLIKKLTENGFYVRYFFPRVLYISWALSQESVAHSPMTTKQSGDTKKLELARPTKLGRITTKNTGKFILDLS